MSNDLKMKCEPGLHLFESRDMSSSCICKLWTQRQFRYFRNAKFIHGARMINLSNTSKRDWAIEHYGRPVAQILNGQVLAIYRSMTDAIRIVGGSNNHNISRSITRGGKSQGYRWQYA